MAILYRSFKIILTTCTSLNHRDLSYLKQNNPPKQQTHNQKKTPTPWREFNTFAGSPVSTQTSKLKLDQIYSSQYGVNEFISYIGWKFPLGQPGKICQYWPKGSQKVR